jgi:ferredoxin
MRIALDERRCQGHGRCYDLAPDVFEADERGHVDLAVNGELPDVLEQDAIVGIRNCPESALAVVSTDDTVHRGRSGCVAAPRRGVFEIR